MERERKCEKPDQKQMPEAAVSGSPQLKKLPPFSLQTYTTRLIIILIRKILEKLRHLFFPKVSADVLHDMYIESIRNIQHVSGVAAVFEILTLCMYIPAVKQFVFSLGYVEGSPNNSEELFVLLCKSDLKLYEMKRFTLAPENGGHDRRKRP